MKKKALIGISVTVLVLFLTSISIVTTFGIWDGAIPSVKLKIKLLDNQKTPVIGAKLTVYEKQGFMSLKERQSYNFPIQEFTENSQPISNSDGLIEISHLSNGLEIGGWAFALFWIIPISFGDPEFIFYIETPDGRTRSFEYTDLYETCDERPTILNRKDNPAKCEFELIL